MNEIRGQVAVDEVQYGEPETIGELLTPTALGDDRFLLRNTHGGWARLFGGQVVAQALAAGTATVPDDRRVNSLHAYFLRAGVRKEPVECVVERERDGATFSNRRIVVRAGVGTDNVDMATWAKLHVPVTDVPDYGTHEVADHAIALMMTLARGVTQLDDGRQNIQR